MQSQDYWISPTINGATGCLSITGNGVVELRVRASQSSDDEAVNTETITTTSEECSFNLYASTSQTQRRQQHNRAQLVAFSSNGQVLRIGNQIWLPEGDNLAARKPFVPKHFSLYLDHLEQHDGYLFVTSRQRVTDIPEIKHEDPKSESKNDTGAVEWSKNGAVDKNAATDAPHADPQAVLTSQISSPNVQANLLLKDQPQSPKASSSSSSDSSSSDTDGNKSETSVEEEELSACESWSEASTEYPSDIAISDFRPQSLQASAPRATSEGTDDDSELETNTSCSCCSSSEQSDNEIVSQDQGRFAATVLDEEEDWRMSEQIYEDNDGYRPASDTDSDDNAGGRAEEEAWDDTGFAVFRNADDFDFTFQAFQSDSEDCSECEGDGGTCKLPDVGVIAKGQPSDCADEIEPPFGMQIAQLHIYDTAQVDNEGQPKRIFGYQIRTKYLLCNSPPTVHPTRSLVVWPLGDGKILFADYKANTYFVKRLRLSRLWSQHVAIDCLFSSDGKKLHAAILEERGEPRKRPKKLKKSSNKRPGLDEKREKEKDKEYDLIVYTYQMSQGKMTRAPPILVARQLLPLGLQKQVPPTFSWDDQNLYVSCVPRSQTLNIYRLKLAGSTVEFPYHKELAKSAPEILTIKLPEWARGREVRYFPSHYPGGIGRPQVVIGPADQKLKAVKKPVEVDAEKKDMSTVNEGETVPEAAETAEQNAKGREKPCSNQQTTNAFVPPTADGSPAAYAKAAAMLAPLTQDGLWKPLAKAEMKTGLPMDHDGRNALDLTGDEKWQRVSVGKELSE